MAMKSDRDPPWRPSSAFLTCGVVSLRICSPDPWVSNPPVPCNSLKHIRGLGLRVRRWRSGLRHEGMLKLPDA